MSSRIIHIMSKSFETKKMINKKNIKSPVSLNKRQCPEWFKDAKLGIFIHWGPYTVPAWAPSGKAIDELIQEGSESLKALPYAEWYLNSLQSSDSPTAIHHRELYGEKYSYDEFGKQFSTDVLCWDPEAWGKLFKSMEAKYVVLTTKLQLVAICH